MNKIIAALKKIAVSLAAGLTFLVVFNLAIGISVNLASANHPEELRAFHKFETVAYP